VQFDLLVLFSMHSRWPKEAQQAVISGLKHGTQWVRPPSRGFFDKADAKIPHYPDE